MKKINFGMFVAAVAMLSACQAKTEEFVAAPEKAGTTLFTASLAADTKTYLGYDENAHVYKNYWDIYDHIYVMSYSDGVPFSSGNAQLVEGAGTTTATFASEVLPGDRYVAYYGYGKMDENYQVMPHIITYQEIYFTEGDGTSYWNYIYPMYAESNGTNFEFKNIASVLKIEVKGNAKLENIRIEANSEDVIMSGYCSVGFSEDGVLQTQMIADSTACNFISYDVNKMLSETEVLECYVVLPAQTYPGGISLTFSGTAGTMVRSFNQDLTFERSQIRTIKDVVFSEENPISWGVVGTMTNWENDIVMSRTDENSYSVSNVYLTAEDEFKFRANGLWDVNFGAYTSDAVSPNTRLPLFYDGVNIKVAEEGFYTFVLYPAEGFVDIIQDLRVVPCANYDEVAAVEDNTYVKVKGYVFGVYARGFIFNIGDYYDNTILVYTFGQNIDYTPVLGNSLELIVQKVTYNGLPELKKVHSYSVLSDKEVDYGYGSYYYDLRDPGFFSSVNIDRYDYVRFIGTLQQRGNYWDVVVEGATRVGNIQFPIQDLTPYIDQKVLVEGWYCGLSGTAPYMNIVLKKIMLPSENGGTEDITPGDDIVELPAL